MIMINIFNNMVIAFNFLIKFDLPLVKIGYVCLFGCLDIAEKFLVRRVMTNKKAVRGKLGYYLRPSQRCGASNVVDGDGRRLLFGPPLVLALERSLLHAHLGPSADMARCVTEVVGVASLRA